MLRIRCIIALGSLPLLLAACAPQPENQTPASSEETGTPDEAGKEASSGVPFLQMRPPQGHALREPEKPVFHIYYDLEGIPDRWIDEWKAGRDLKISQLPLSPDPALWPKDADLVIAAPGRLDRQHVKPFPSEAPPARANPAFLHHPFDPDQTLTRPWRWTPWVLMRHTPTDATPPAAATEPVWTNRPDVARGWWLKSQRLSANHPMNAVLEEKWQAQLTRIIPAMEPIDALWMHLLEGKIPAAHLPLAWKLRQESTPISWTIPPQGTLIHFDQLAVGRDSDQPELALEWVAFLSDPQRQKSLTEVTGYYPVQRPLGREVPDVVGSPPGWWDRSEFLVGTPSPPKAPAPLQPLRTEPSAQAPVVVPLEKPEDIKPTAEPGPVSAR